MIEDILGNFNKNVESVLLLVQDDLNKVKTGRAKPGLVEGLKVEAYGTKMDLKELASITAPDPNLLVISVWDKNLLEVIERAIASSDLSLNPQVSKEVIRISIPPLTEETRNDLVKLVYQKLELGKVLLRQARNEAKSRIEKLKGGAGVSEDDIQGWLEDLQREVEMVMGKIDDLGKKKESALKAI